jgi:hypothetical protein
LRSWEKGLEYAAPVSRRSVWWNDPWAAQSMFNSPNF